MAWSVYIAKCKDGSLYTGIAIDPVKRLRCHNNGTGSKYIRSKGAATLVYAERLPNESSARRRESEIQSWPRQKKLHLIASRV